MESTKKELTVLGIHLDTHDSGAALIEKGTILAAINEERLSRIKMDGGMPYQSITEVLRIAGRTYADIGVLAISGLTPGWRKPWYFFWQQHQRVWFTKFRYLKSFLHRKSFDRGRLLRQTGIEGVRQYLSVRKGIDQIISQCRAGGFTGEIRFVDHDRNHAAGSYYTSGRSSGLVAILEGSSFVNTASFWWAENGTMKKIHTLSLPHSLGRYYEVVTTILGFHAKKHGGKITGLAGFGNPSVAYDKVAALLSVDGLEVRVSPKLYCLYDEFYANQRTLPTYFAGVSREDVAAAFQKRLEDVTITLIQTLLKQYPTDTLLLGGGVCANVKLNMELMRLPGIKHISIHPGMGDVGQALGAALNAYREQDPTFQPFRLRDVYFGPSYSDTQIEEALKKAGVVYEKQTNIAESIAALLVQKRVVAVCEGRMEYGPRALGNRSILYEAVDPKVNDWLNQRLKRSEFMPFAPVTLAERAGDCYDAAELEKCSDTARFMTIAVKVTPFMKERMPAAVHVDDTARPQLVNKEDNPLYYNILKAYERQTGLPSLINTSFNMHEEPIVCSPEDAIRAYLDGQLDALAIGSYLVVRPS